MPTMMTQSSFKPNGRILEKKDQFIRGFDVSDKAMRHLKKNKFFFFSFVRHPFERLVSSYMDKIIRLGDQWYKTVAPDMTGNRLQNEKYRKVAHQWYQEDHSFSSYVDLVLNRYSKGKVLDMHWKPMYDHCNYCYFKYDFIGRMETFNEDVKYVIKTNALEDKISIKDSEFQANSVGNGTNTLAKELFHKNLSRDQIENLYQYYKMDFELFGYDAKPYMKNN